MGNDIDKIGFANVGNNPFYKEFTVGAMLPVIFPDNVHNPIQKKLTNTSVDTLVNATDKEIDKDSDGIALRKIDNKVEEVYEKAIKDYGEFIITKRYGCYSKESDESKNIWNPIVEIEGYTNRFRYRCEVLVVDNDKIFMQKLGDKDYRIPGGGCDMNETPDQTAIREAREEAYLLVKDVILGAKRIYIDKVADWVKKQIPENLQWDGYYTEVFVGKYDGKYTGSVDEEDKDNGFPKKGKWYKIDDVWDMLFPDHKRALSKYLAEFGDLDFVKDKVEELHLNNAAILSRSASLQESVMFEYVKNRSKLPDEVFGIPELRKYPLHDKRHVISAIKLFNHVDKEHEEQLAKKIISKIHEYDIDISMIGEKNRLRNYLSDSMLKKIEERTNNMNNIDDLELFFFGESSEKGDSDIPDEIEAIVKTIEKKGYDVKYASPGYSNTRFSNDKDDDGVINGKMQSTGRIIFARNYAFDTTPHGWVWKVLDNGSKALYVKPYTYNEKMGTEAEAFKKWKQVYMQGLREWAANMQEVGDKSDHQPDVNFS